jgi:hypothetical protein
MQSVEDTQLEQVSGIALATGKGRQTSDVWQLFSTDESPQLLLSACCMHCKVEVTYMKKSERVKSHLLRFKSFISVMMSMDVAERPDWFNEESNERLQSSFSSRSGNSLTHSSIKTFYHRHLARRSWRGLRITLTCAITSQNLISFESKRGTCWKHSRLVGQMLYDMIGVNWLALHWVDATPM